MSVRGSFWRSGLVASGTSSQPWFCLVRGPLRTDKASPVSLGDLFQYCIAFKMTQFFLIPVLHLRQNAELLDFWLGFFFHEKLEKMIDLD